ncbi:MAG: hypothetical protein FWG06_00300, partial [Clostridiales bacterium]|nr:hypothetical protein [Clostridiales bacterium]
MQAFVIIMALLQVIAFMVLARHMRAELARAKDSGAAAQREARLLELYGHVEELMDVFESYIEEVRGDIDKERAALLEMSRQAMLVYHRMENGEWRMENEKETPNSQLPTPNSQFSTLNSQLPTPNSQLSTLN